jgi:dTDP-4-amino-4,6-dideoxygalactose transaminase
VAPSVFTNDDNHRYSEADVEAVAKTMRGGSLSVVFGRQTMRFEKEMARFVGVDNAVATSSGTTALELALDLCDIGFGDEVIVPGYAFIALVSAVLRNLAVPVFADICPESWNLTAAGVEAAITDRTRAVIVAHMFGNPAEVARIRDLCVPQGIAVIEDCAQAAGATLDGCQVGAFGSVGCFSFNEIKNLTTGEGGMLVLAEAERAQLARVLRLHGTRDLVGAELAGKSTMTEMEAALGRSQLARLAEENAQRTAFGLRLASLLDQVPGVTPQRTPAGGTHVYSRFVFTVAGDRGEVAASLARQGLAARPVYGTPMYRQPMVAQLADGSAARGLARSYLAVYGKPSPLARWTTDRLPVTEEFCTRQLGFVVPPRPTLAHADRIAELVAASRAVEVVA